MEGFSITVSLSSGFYCATNNIEFGPVGNALCVVLYFGNKMPSWLEAKVIITKAVGSLGGQVRFGDVDIVRHGDI